MDFCEYTVTAGSSVSVTVPCFMGGEDACRMNRFYEAALGDLYGYGAELTENVRRTGFFCRCTVNEDDGVITVTLQLTYRKPGEPSVRKTIVHRWRGGFLVREKKVRFRCVRRMR